MFAHSTPLAYAIGASSTSKSLIRNVDMGVSASSFLAIPQFQHLPFPSTNGHAAFVSQTGSGTYNNFKGNNYRSKGGKKFNAGYQSSSHQGFTQSPIPSQYQFQNVGAPMASGQSFQPSLIC